VALFAAVILKMTLRFGKSPRKSDYRTLRFGSYLDMTVIPPPPPSFNALARTKIGPSVSTFFPMDGNDLYGDCVVAALAHAETLDHALIGQIKIAPAQDVIDLYFKLAGGIDNGLIVLDTLNYWRKNRALYDQLVAYAGLQPLNHVAVKQAISIFGGCFIGFQVQENAIPDFEAGKAWTPGNLTLDGHCVYAVGYDADTVTVLTWGNTQKGTWAWWDECVDEAYALLPIESTVTGFSPGFNFNQLRLDLHKVSG
jgi:hypothetical protein